MSRHLTLRKLIERVTKQAGGDIEKAMDMSLSVGVSDGHRNFATAELFDEYPRYMEPRDDYAGCIRLDAVLSNNRLVAEKKGAA